MVCRLTPAAAVDMVAPSLPPGFTAPLPETILGFTKRGDFLSFAPCVPRGGTVLKSSIATVRRCTAAVWRTRIASKPAQ